MSVTVASVVRTALMFYAEFALHNIVPLKLEHFIITVRLSCDGSGDLAA